jgi:hypothetical protein
MLEDVLGIGYEHFPEDVRKEVVDQYPRINFKEDIAKAFLGGSSPTPLYRSSTSSGLYAAMPGVVCREIASQAT